MKSCVLFLSLLLCTLCVNAQQVDADFLYPKSGNDVLYRYLVVGLPTGGVGGLMWNHTDPGFGNGDDFTIYTYSNRDLVLKTNMGKIFLNADKVGISTVNPQAKLHIPNGDIIVGGPEGVVNNINASLFVKSRGDNSTTYPFYVGKNASGSDLFWVRGDGNGFLRGNLGIGTINPDAPLTVKGKIHAEEVQVDMTVPGPDYVFEKDYDLLPLAELEAYINQNKHLPEVPSAKEMEANGLNLKEMNLLLLKKVEELTLHVIELKKETVRQQAEINDLKGKK